MWNNLDGFSLVEQSRTDLQRRRTRMSLGIAWQLRGINWIYLSSPHCQLPITPHDQ